MSQIVTLNGRPLDLDWKPSLKVGNPPLWRTPSILNSQMAHGITINGYDYPPALSGSVLYFPGLPGQGITIWDRSGNGNNGTITGATWTRLPSGLWVLSFDGDDYITLPSGIFPNNNLAVSAWAKSSATGSFQCLVAARDDYYFRCQTETTAEKMRLYVEIAAGGKDVDSNAAVTDGKWHHYVAIKSSTTGISMYVDGVLQTDTDGTATGNLDASAGTNTIGAQNTGIPGNFWVGDSALPIVFSPVPTTSLINYIYKSQRHLFGV